MPGPLISAGELRELLGRVVVLDVRGEVVDGEPRYRAYPDRYAAGHIPGALFVDWRQAFTDRDAEVPVTVAAPEAVAAEATALGIGEGARVVTYDDYRNALAGRVAWVLRSHGGDARILDGGLAAWVEAGGELETGVVDPVPATRPFPVHSRERLIDLDAMRRRLDAGVQVVDARPTPQYTGAETHSRRAGHIPGARSMPYTDLLAADGRFLPPPELRDRLERAGVDLAAPAVAYCNGGVSATVVGNAIELAGGRPAEVYDGSWNEWGSRDDLPLER